MTGLPELLTLAVTAVLYLLGIVLTVAVVTLGARIALMLAGPIGLTRALGQFGAEVARAYHSARGG